MNEVINWHPDWDYVSRDGEFSVREGSGYVFMKFDLTTDVYHLAVARKVWDEAVEALSNPQPQPEG